MNQSGSTIAGPIQSTDQNALSTITLAELLAHFPLPRPLYIHESGALCYQLIEQLQNNLLHCPLTEGKTSLKFPTLANIRITETGLAFVHLSSKKFQSLSDWLNVLAQTLRHHTLITSAQESDTFRSLIESLNQPYVQTDHVLERVQIWQTTCLFLCSSHSSNRDPNTNCLLQLLHNRSGQAHVSGLCINEMRAKRLIICKTLSNCAQLSINTDDTVDQFCPKPKVRTFFHDQSAGMIDREAFNIWVERWRCVNAEFLARSLINHGSTTGMHVSKMTQNILVNATDVLSQPAINNRKQISVTQIRSQLSSSELHQTPPIQGVCMRTLKSMYFSLISKPLSLLQKGLKDVRYQVGPGLIQSNVVAKTLHGLDRILGDSNSSTSSRDQSDLELSSFEDRKKCNT